LKSVTSTNSYLFFSQEVFESNEESFKSNKKTLIAVIISKNSLWAAENINNSVMKTFKKNLELDSFHNKTFLWRKKSFFSSLAVAQKEQLEFKHLATQQFPR